MMFPISPKAVKGSILHIHVDRLQATLDRLKPWKQRRYIPWYSRRCAEKKGLADPETLISQRCLVRCQAGTGELRLNKWALHFIFVMPSQKIFDSAHLS